MSLCGSGFVSFYMCRSMSLCIWFAVGLCVYVSLNLFLCLYLQFLEGKKSSLGKFKSGLSVFWLDNNVAKLLSCLGWRSLDVAL